MLELLYRLEGWCAFLVVLMFCTGVWIFFIETAKKLR